MLRVEFDHDGNGTLTVRLQGRLVGLYAEDARVTLARYPFPTATVVDLTEVTFVDPFGERVLLWLGQLGAKFVAVNVYARSLCERLQLQVSEHHAGSVSVTDTQVLE
jgi:anti-anti-sigma regulatory factor